MCICTLVSSSLRSLTGPLKRKDDSWKLLPPGGLGSVSLDTSMRSNTEEGHEHKSQDHQSLSAEAPHH